MAIEVEFTFKQFSREMRAFTRRQVPFAFSVALNNTIIDAQHELQGDLPTTFTIRNSWTAKGIRTERATKNRLEAIVGSVDPYMADQAAGGSRKSRGKSLAIPVQARPRKKSKTPRSKHPRAMGLVRGSTGKGGKPFVKKMADGTIAVFKARKTRKGSKRRKPKLRLMWYLAKRPIKINQAWDLESVLQTVVGREWAGHMELAWAHALRTGRMR